ncbi:MAG: hypothetical protein AB1439_01075 [candidate division FCPU426 bacterium]
MNDFPFILSRTLVMEPQLGSAWAGEMVLNPGLAQDPKTGNVIMLFRATGPYPQKRLPGKPLPFPIFLGFAGSDDQGRTWQIDWERPALAPALSYRQEELYLTNREGKQVVNYANGCIEDPRLFWLEGRCYLIAATRLMPPGPYWEHDDPVQCSPEWILAPDQPFGRAARENVTNNVLYEVDLDALTRREYERAFRYVIHLTNPEYGENRDVVLFPEKMQIRGQTRYVCLHRPFTPQAYPAVGRPLKPSILLCSAERFEHFWREENQTVFASPVFPWEGDRIGASTPPLRISDREWLLCYHGKQDAEVGYTQSFMILEDVPDSTPRITHRCSERLLVARESWEQPHKFKTPCIFITGLIRLGGELLISYGAADERVGVMRLDLAGLVDHVRRFTAEGVKQ